MKIRICAITPAVVLLRYISNKDELRFKPTSLLYLVVVKNLENDQFDIQLYFDRNRLIWKYAKKDQKTGKLISISEEPALTLLLDGENSRFREILP